MCLLNNEAIMVAYKTTKYTQFSILDHMHADFVTKNIRATEGGYHVAIWTERH